MSSITLTADYAPDIQGAQAYAQITRQGTPFVPEQIPIGISWDTPITVLIPLRAGYNTG